MQPNQSAYRFQIFVLSAGLIITAGKIIAWWLTDSNAILTDALEGFVNIFAGAFTLYSLYLSASPRDRSHPYGHGKIEFISASIEGSMISVTGVLMIAKAVYGFFFPSELGQLEVGIIIVGVAGAVNYILGHFSESKGKATHSLALVSGGKHLKSDAYSTIGLLIGLGIIHFTEMNWLDNILAILLGLIILRTGTVILRKSIAGIMDEADENLLEELTKILEANREPNWVDLHNLRIIQYGPVIHIDCHVTVPWYFTVKEAHAEAEKIDAIISQYLQREHELFIHTDPCIESSCEICLKSDCDKRIHPFIKRKEWKLDIVLKNRKHHL